MATVVKEVVLTREENPHGFGSRHILDCGHVISDCDHDPVHYDPGTEVPCAECQHSENGACECGRDHDPKAVNSACPKCGACHFKHGEYIPDDDFPLSRCKKCGEVHLWD